MKPKYETATKPKYETREGNNKEKDDEREGKKK